MTAPDIALFATVVGSIVLFGGAAALALGWAFRDGQFDNFDQGAKSIFGPDEPIGAATDAFPGADPTETDRAQPAEDFEVIAVTTVAIGDGGVPNKVVDAVTKSL